MALCQKYSRIFKKESNSDIFYLSSKSTLTLSKPPQASFRLRRFVCSNFSPAAAVGQFIASQNFIPRYTVGSLHPSILATRGMAPLMRKIFLSLSMRSMFVRFVHGEVLRYILSIKALSAPG